MVGPRWETHNVVLRKMYEAYKHYTYKKCIYESLWIYSYIQINYNDYNLIEIKQSKFIVFFVESIINY